MSEIHVCDKVRLVRDVPTLGLFRGETGVVQSTWHAPVKVFEVEFHPRPCGAAVRTLLFRGFLELIEQRPG